MPQTQGTGKWANDGYKPQPIDKTYADTVLNAGSVQSVENQKAPKGSIFKVYMPNDKRVSPVPGKDFKGAGGRDN